jgi:hypothetical protein
MTVTRSLCSYGVAFYLAAVGTALNAVSLAVLLVGACCCGRKLAGPGGAAYL